MINCTALFVLCEQTQVCNDMSKRLHLLEDCWRGGRLSLPVRKRMEHLSQGNWSWNNLPSLPRISDLPEYLSVSLSLRVAAGSLGLS